MIGPALDLKWADRHAVEPEEDDVSFIGRVDNRDRVEQEGWCRELPIELQFSSDTSESLPNGQ